MYEEIVEVDYDYKPGRPAPYTGDHDSERFSDPGDPPEVDNLTITLMGVDITETIEKYHLNLYMRILNKAYDSGD